MSCVLSLLNSAMERERVGAAAEDISDLSPLSHPTKRRRGGMGRSYGGDNYRIVRSCCLVLNSSVGHDGVI